MDRSKATYEDFKARIPSQLNGKDQVANYAIRTDSGNRDPSYIKKDVIWILALVFFACLFFGLLPWFIMHIASRDPYSLVRTPPYKIHMKTDDHGIDFYVKSGFDKKYPVGTPARAELEKSVIKEYIDIKQRYCHHELSVRWYSGYNDYPMPDCDALKSKNITITPFFP